MFTVLQVFLKQVLFSFGSWKLIIKFTCVIEVVIIYLHNKCFKIINVL